jgi:hypothetical protein
MCESVTASFRHFFLLRLFNLVYDSPPGSPSPPLPLPVLHPLWPRLLPASHQQCPYWVVVPSVLPLPPSPISFSYNSKYKRHPPSPSLSNPTVSTPIQISDTAIFDSKRATHSASARPVAHCNCPGPVGHDAGVQR